MYLMAKEYIQKHKFTDKNVQPVLLLCVKIFALKQLNAKALRQINEKNDFKLLDVLHHFTSGLKAFATES